MLRDTDNCDWSDESSSDYDMKTDEVIRSSSKSKQRKRVEVVREFITKFYICNQ